MKQTKEGYEKTCKLCGKKFYQLSKKLLEYNFNVHMAHCKREEHDIQKT